jgi:ribosome-associated protein
LSDTPSKPKRPERPEDTRAAAMLCAAAAFQKKGRDLALLDVAELSGYADYFLLVSGRSTRQATSIAENIHRAMKKSGRKSRGNEGLKEGRWACLDFGDVVVHVFHEPVRTYYDLDALWADAPQLELDPKKLDKLMLPEQENLPRFEDWDDFEL